MPSTMRIQVGKEDQSLDEHLYNLIKEHPGLSLPVIVPRHKHPNWYRTRNTVRGVLKLMVREGRLRVERQGRTNHYFVSDGEH